jgi:hypothetical protein
MKPWLPKYNRCSSYMRRASSLGVGSSALVRMVVGIVCARAPWAICGMLTSDTRGARLLRKTVPASLFVLSLVGLSLSRPLLTDTHIGAAAATVLALFCSVLLAGFIVWVASIVDHDEIERRKIEEAQQLSSEQLNRLLNHIEEPAEGARLRRKVTLALIFAILLTGRLGLLSWLDVQQATETASRRSALLSARKARRAGQAGRRPAGGPVRPTGGGRKRDGRKRRIKRFYKSFSADAFSPKLSVSRSRIAQPRSCVPCSIRDGGHLSRGVQ